MPSVPRLFPDRTIVCLASGPSLTREDVEACRGIVPAVAVNDTYQWAPWADVLYACDARWWELHQGAQEFQGLKFALEKKADKWPGVTVLEHTGDRGLERDPSGVRTGKNSGYQAINVAVHLGAKRILLLGYDMAAQGKRTHFAGHRPAPYHASSPYPFFADMFGSMTADLKALGVDVVNCSRETALKCFPRRSLAKALATCEVLA